MARCIFNCEWLDLGTGPEAARLDVSYMRDKFFNVGIKAAVLFTKGLHCMHWHARVARSVVLALTLLMTQTTRYACGCCEQRGTLTRAYPSPTIRAAFLSGKKLRWRQGRPTPWWAASAQQAQRQTCGTNRRARPIFVNKM